MNDKVRYSHVMRIFEFLPLGNRLHGASAQLLPFVYLVPRPVPPLGPPGFDWFSPSRQWGTELANSVIASGTRSNGTFVCSPSVGKRSGCRLSDRVLPLAFFLLRSSPYPPWTTDFQTARGLPLGSLSLPKTCGKCLTVVRRRDVFVSSSDTQ